jgi:hypothetical protein
MGTPKAPDAATRLCTLRLNLAGRSDINCADQGAIRLDRAMRRPSTKDADEELARLVLKRALRTRVKRVDKSPLQGMYDLEVCYPDGRLGACEVVSARDETRTALETAASRRGYTRCNELSRLWMVIVKPGTILKNIRHRVPSLLAQLECQGIDHMRGVNHRYVPSEFGGLGTNLDKLGIESCSSCRPTSKHPPGFLLWPGVLADWVRDGDSVTGFCEQLLADSSCQDVLDKLRGSNADERHVVVILTFSQVGPHTAIDTGAFPSSPPELPDGIDWLWIIASKAPPVRAVYWKPMDGWSEVALVA